MNEKVTTNLLLDRLTKFVDPKHFKGCTAEDIRKLENTFGERLPAAYRTFLSIAGRGAGEFMSDLTIFFPRIVGLTDRIRKDFEGLLDLPTNAFVFMERMGETFLYFHLGEGDDPPIFGWSEKSRKTQKLFDSFSAFIADELRGFQEISS